MKTALTILAGLGALAASINLGEIRRDPDTKGWAFGLGLLALVGFGYWASVS